MIFFLRQKVSHSFSGLLRKSFDGWLHDFPAPSVYFLFVFSGSFLTRSSFFRVKVPTFADIELRSFCFEDILELTFLFHFVELTSCDSAIRAKLIQTKLHGLIEELFEFDDVVVLFLVFFLQDNRFFLLKRILERHHI